MNNYSENLFQQGVENLKKKNFSEAENCFEKLKNFDPTNKNILKNLLVSCVQNEKFEKSEKIVQAMFELGSREKELIELLLSTGDLLIIETAPRDTLWGIGMSGSNIDIYNPQKWKGANILGLALMRVRKTLSEMKR